MKNPVEIEYANYLKTPRTTIDLMKHFSARTNAVWQVLRTLRLRGIAHHTIDGRWKITEDDDDVPLIPVTPLQTRYIKYLRAPHSTKDMMAEFGQNVSAVQQVTRTLRLMEYVEAVGRGSQQGKGGCWKMWKTTDKGLDVI